MADFVTPEERFRATALVHGKMLEALWTEVLGKYAEDDQEALAIAGDTLRRLEAELSDPLFGASAEMQRFAVRTMEDMWVVIRQTLASHRKPIGYRPASLGRSPGSGPTGPTDGAPEQ